MMTEKEVRGLLLMLLAGKKSCDVVPGILGVAFDCCDGCDTEIETAVALLTIDNHLGDKDD